MVRMAWLVCIAWEWVSGARGVPGSAPIVRMRLGVGEGSLRREGGCCPLI